MAESAVELNRKIREAKDLQSVVRAMKAMAAANITQYDRAVRSLKLYQHNVTDGLSIALKKETLVATLKRKKTNIQTRSICVVVIGTDQGLVGRFNENIANYSERLLKALPKEPQIIVVGGRAASYLNNVNLKPIAFFDTPNSVQEISALISRILEKALELMGEQPIIELHLIYNQMNKDLEYETRRQRLLPFDKDQLNQWMGQSWENRKKPEMLGDEMKTFRAFIREYLFVSLYRASAESLAAENQTRLLAMERAEKNINEMLEHFEHQFHHLRQSDIDAELFDLVSGYEALTRK